MSDYIKNGTPVGGASLPTASDAGQVPLSSGAGTTYTAADFGATMGAAMGGLVGSVAGKTVIGDGAGGVATTSADVSAVLAAANAAAARSAMFPTTTYDMSSSTGWTAHAGTVAGQTAAVTGGVGRLTCAASTSNSSNPMTPTRASIYRAIPSTVDPTRYRVIWRIATITGAGLYLFLQPVVADYTVSCAPNVYAGCSLAGAVDTGYAPDGSTVINSSDTADATVPTGGTGWMMVEVAGSIVDIYSGTGTSTDPPAPTAWKFAKQQNLNPLAGVSATGHIPGVADSAARVLLTVMRWSITANATAGNKVAEFDDVRVSSLFAPLPGMS